jgi:hypothetical protein
MLCTGGGARRALGTSRAHDAAARLTAPHARALLLVVGELLPRPTVSRHLVRAGVGVLRQRRKSACSIERMPSLARLACHALRPLEGCGATTHDEDTRGDELPPRACEFGTLSWCLWWRVFADKTSPICMGKKNRKKTLETG